MKKILLIAMVFSAAISSRAMAADTLKVSFNVSGAVWGGCAKALAAALVQGGVKEATKIKPNKGKTPVLVVGQIETDVDLVTLATAVNRAKTPHVKTFPPGLALVVLAELDKESAAAALKALAKVKGVDSKGTKANVKAGQISIKLLGLDGSSGAKLKIADIRIALKTAGIDASFSKK